jgi:hypothetical protein
VHQLTVFANWRKPENAMLIEDQLDRALLPLVLLLAVAVIAFAVMRLAQ